MRTIYLDYNATTPLDPAVQAAMLPALAEMYGNPSSAHSVGRQTRALLDEARERVAGVWACRASEIIFTSGGTESNNLAILGVARALKEKGRHLVTSAIEHQAVLQPLRWLVRHEGFELTCVLPDGQGRVDPQAVRAAIRPDTVLVSIMAANNEVGTMQPVAEIGALCRQAGVLFHTDAVQSLGKVPFSSIHQFGADLVSACAHKLHGPKGAGALFVRSGVRLEPVLLGGSHENDRRAGTENLSAILGLAEAMERFLTPPILASALVNTLSVQLRQALAALPEVAVLSPSSNCLPNTIALTVEGCDSISLVAALDLEGICVSGGSACSSGALEASHVLTAMGVPSHLCKSLLRFSLGRDTTPDDIAWVASRLPGVVARIRNPGLVGNSR